MHCKIGDYTEKLDTVRLSQTVAQEVINTFALLFDSAS